MNAPTMTRPLVTTWCLSKWSVLLIILAVGLAFRGHEMETQPLV